MAIEIVDFPMKNGDFPWQNVSSPEGSPHGHSPFLVPSQELLHAILAAYCSAGLPWHGDEILRMSQEELGVEVHVDPIKDLGISFFCS